MIEKKGKDDDESDNGALKGAAAAQSGRSRLDFLWF